MPRRSVHLDPDTIGKLEQFARIRHVSPERAHTLCIQEAYRSLSLEDLEADLKAELEKQTPHLWIVATDAAVLGARL